MIIDRIERANLYVGLGPGLKTALEALVAGELPRRPDGRYELDGEGMFAIVQSYDTKPREQGAWEAHQRYIDVQYIVEGEELMGYAPTEGLIVRDPYDVQKDVMFFRGPAESLVRVQTGMFTIFFPHDAHMPNLAIDGPTKVKKVVVKVARSSSESSL